MCRLSASPLGAVNVTHANFGGELTEHERKRLYTLGYLCDPAVRLRELLASPK